jgi:hypothetical protein
MTEERKKKMHHLRGTIYDDHKHTHDQTLPLSWAKQERDFTHLHREIK